MDKIIINECRNFNVRNKFKNFNKEDNYFLIF